MQPTRLELEEKLGRKVTSVTTYKYLGKREARWKAPRPLHRKKDPAKVEAFRAELGGKLHAQQIAMERRVHLRVMHERDSQPETTRPGVTLLIDRPKGVPRDFSSLAESRIWDASGRISRGLRDDHHSPAHLRLRRRDGIPPSRRPRTSADVRRLAGGARGVYFHRSMKAPVPASFRPERPAVLQLLPRAAGRPCPVPRS